MSKGHRSELKKRIRIKEAKIIKSGNIISLSEEEIHQKIKKYGFKNYRIEVWGDITLKSELDDWIIEIHDQHIRLLHKTKGSASLKGNMRSSYHIQDVFYDLDFCLQSIKSHDDYRSRKT